MRYKYFTAEERYVIYHLVMAKFCCRETGRRLQSHLLSISREVKRNGAVWETYRNQ